MREMAPFMAVLAITLTVAAGYAVNALRAVRAAIRRRSSARAAR